VCNSQTGKTVQFQPLLISSTTSANFADLIIGYRVPGVASTGFGGVGAAVASSGFNTDGTAWSIPAGILPQLTLTSNSTGAKASFASGLPYNYTVGSGLDLVYGSDNKGSLSQTGGVLGSTSASNISNSVANSEIIPAFIGGSCEDIAPSCSGWWNNITSKLINRDITRCLTQTTCTDMTMSGNQPAGGRAYWDPKRSACIQDPDASVDDGGCTDGFGANVQRVCRDAQGKCEINGALDQCKNYDDCKAAHGAWDTWLLRNKCRAAKSDCVSGSVMTYINGDIGVNGTTTNSGRSFTTSGDQWLCDRPY